MAHYEVTMEDGRVLSVNSDSSDESRIRQQANHQEITRRVHEERTGRPTKRSNWERPKAGGNDVSIAVSVKKVKD